MKLKASSLRKKIHKIAKSLSRLHKKENSQIYNIRNERGIITTEPWTIKEYDKQLNL
jgi:hypothetical protein